MGKTTDASAVVQEALNRQLRAQGGRMLTCSATPTPSCGYSRRFGQGLVVHGCRRLIYAQWRVGVEVGVFEGSTSADAG